METVIGEEADDHQQKRDEPLTDDLRTVFRDKIHSRFRREVHQRREEQGEEEDRHHDAPIAEAVAYLAFGDHECAFEVVAGDKSVLHNCRRLNLLLRRLVLFHRAQIHRF